MRKKGCILGWCCLILMAQAAWCAQGFNTPSPSGPRDGAPRPDLSRPLSSADCIRIALDQNRKRRISRLAVETAEEQHQEALSSFWPSMSFESAYNLLDEDVNFIFPRETSQYTISMPALSPYPFQSTVTVPEKTITVLDRQNVLSRLQMSYPLYTGGLRRSTLAAARAGVQAARQALRRTELEIVQDVQRMYYGVILARHLARIGKNTLARLRTTTEVTENLYRKGSGSVTKLDYLRAKVILESARSVVEKLSANVTLAEAALANTMGLPWDTTVNLSETQIPFIPVKGDPKELVASAYRFNPDWKRLEAGLDAAQALVEKAKAGHWPKVALTGTLWRLYTGTDGSGLATDENEAGWSVGIGVKLPIFSGFLTTHQVNEAKTRLRQLESQQILLKEGLALQVKSALIRMDRAQNIRASSMEAAADAKAHRELAEKAYLNDLISTQTVLESQLVEALTAAGAEKAQYEQAVARFGMDFIIGREVRSRIQPDG
jgi:outer membrane protein